MKIVLHQITKTLLGAGLFLAVLISAAVQAQFWSNKQPTLLPEEEAFSVSASVNEQGRLQIDWSIADGYYMYRDQFAVQSLSDNVELGELSFPQGVIEDDPEFGEVEVYFFNAGLSSSVSGAGTLDLLVKGQGCNKPVGVCYPPMARNLSIELPENLAAITASSTEISTGSDSGDRGLSQSGSGAEKTFIGYMISAFLAGILLSFTPCVLPMIPIVAGIVAGQQSSSRWRAGGLATCYVAGTVVTYIIAGAIAGATGAQLQAWFQNGWVIGAICLLLLALALSLFGLFRIELPSGLQTRLNAAGGNTRSAVLSSFSLGLVSALVVGACVSPVLILALGAAITQGDPILGGAIMGSMALGMGLLLVAFGFGAGWLLPRAGVWMEHIQVLFGFMVLGVAVYLLAAFPVLPILLLWAAVLLASGFYIWHMAAQTERALLQSILRTMAAGLLLWGGLCVVGGASKGDDVLRPLAGLALNSGGDAGQTLSFNRTTTLEQVQQQLDSAKLAAQPAMLDFYADWCLDCKRMHRTTFKRDTVHRALQGWRLIEVDVTQTSEISEEVKRHFGVFGPPATLFFRPDGQELQSLRQYGYLNEAEFLNLVGKASEQ